MVAMLAMASSAPAQNQPAPRPDPLARFTPAQKQQLLQGKAVFEYKTDSGDKAQSGYGRAMIIIAAPANTCFDIFSRLEEQTEYFPHKTGSKIVNTDGNTVWLQNKFYFYIAEVFYTSKYTIDRQKLRFDFEMDKGYPHDLKESSGYFLFEPIDRNRTLFTYGVTKLDTGVPVPNLITEFLSSRDLPAEVTNVKKRIESGGKWKTSWP